MYLVIGANGRTGRHLVKHLRAAGEQVIAMVRDPAQADRFEQLGASVHVHDLDEDFAPAFAGVHTVIYAAGSAEDQGEVEEQAYDRDAIIRSCDYARAAPGVKRLVVISALIAADPDQAKVLRHYSEMKRAGDDYVVASGMPYLILRPGPLDDTPAKHSVALQDHPVEVQPPVSREDVALLTVRALAAGVENRIIGFTGGYTSIDTVVSQLR